MNNEIKILFVFLAFIISTGLAYSQTNAKTYSYGIWIREYQKGWIDAENSFWLIESPIGFENLDSELIDVSSLCRPLALTAESCCNDDTYQKNIKGQYYAGEAVEVYQFFDSNKSIKFKVGAKTVKIVKMEQSNCKCSNDYVDCYNGFKKVASIFNYRFLELSKTEKKNFKKNKKELTEYFEKIN